MQIELPNLRKQVWGAASTVTLMMRNVVYWPRPRPVTIYLQPVLLLKVLLASVDAPRKLHACACASTDQDILKKCTLRIFEAWKPVQIRFTSQYVSKIIHNNGWLVSHRICDRVISIVGQTHTHFYYYYTLYYSLSPYDLTSNRRKQ